MTTGVAYLLTDTKLAARLVVSLYSLRKHYDGPIVLFTTRPESRRIGMLCKDDPALGVDTTSIPERPGDGHISAYLTKPATMLASPFEATVYLDADTLITGSIAPLLASAEAAEVTATTFCGQRTTDPPTHGRLQEWAATIGRSHPSHRLLPLLERALAHPLPVVNAGVVAMQRSAAILRDWNEMIQFAADLPLPGDTTLQLLLQEYAHVLLGTEYNCHPANCPQMPDVRIWHFAGGDHLRKTACRELWLPAYRECRRRNVARITDWSCVARRRGPPPESVSS